MCSVCCPAHVKAISDFLQNILQQRMLSHFPSLFVFGPSSCLGLQALVEGKHNLPQSLTRRIRDVSDLVVAGDRKRKPSAELSLRHCLIQEYCHMFVDVWWRSAMLKKHLVCFQVAGMLTTNPTCDGEIIPLTA